MDFAYKSPSHNLEKKRSNTTSSKNSVLNYLDFFNLERHSVDFLLGEVKASLFLMTVTVLKNVRAPTAFHLASDGLQRTPTPKKTPENHLAQR